MRWEDLTRQFKEELKTAMIKYVIYGETQPIVDTVQSIQRESFEEGLQYAVDVLQMITTEEK